MMAEPEFPRVDVVVSILRNSDRQLLWIWNDHWGSFSLPMTKRRRGDSVNVTESPRYAAVRVGAETMGVPVRIREQWVSIPELLVSERDYTIKHYAYDVFLVEPHSAFDQPDQWTIRSPHIWLTPHRALSGEFEPLSKSALAIARALITGGKVAGRRQPTSTVIIQRQVEGKRDFLLRWNKHWGYTLPSKRRDANEAPSAGAERVVRDELGLLPDIGVTVSTARHKEGQHDVEKYPTYGVSKTKGSPAYGEPTDYQHALFDAVIQGSASLKSDEPLVWAGEDEIRAGFTAGRQPSTPSATPHPGKISETTCEILAELGYIPWLVVGTMEIVSP